MSIDSVGSGHVGQVSASAKIPRKDPRTLVNINEILDHLSALQSEETDLSNTLSDLLSRRDLITSSLSKLEAVTPKLDDLRSDSQQLFSQVLVTSRIADRVGGRVRSIDEEMKRVTEAADHISRVMELKSSLTQLQFCIESHDWESATRHCARAMAVPAEVISGRFAESAIPTSENPLPPAQSLQAARDRLLAIFKQQFEEASCARNAAATSRFFKLFPVVGWEAEGLEAYASFAVDLVRIRAPSSAKTSSSLYYVTSISALFENVAMIVDQHRPIVEKYYGTGKMVPVVRRLLEECDRVLKQAITGWKEDRLIDIKVFTTIIVEILYLLICGLLQLAEISKSSLAISGHRQTPQSDEDYDPRDIDKILYEIAGMSARWSLFRKFLAEEHQVQDEGTEQLTFQTARDVKASAENSLLSLVEQTEARHYFDDLMASCYVPMEVWYTRTVVHKAHRLSNPESSQPITTTTPDDVFYILKTVYNRILSTGSDITVTRMTNLLKDIIDKDYSGGIKSKLDEVYRSSGSTISSTRSDMSELGSRNMFVMLLNDLDVSCSHMERLVKDMGDHPSLSQLFLKMEVEGVKKAIMSLNTMIPKFRWTIKSGIEQLFNQLMRPKLRTLIPDVYKDISYALNEESYSSAEHQDAVKKRFVKVWEDLTEGYKDTFTDNNYKQLFGQALDVILRPWEKYVLTLRFSELGAIRFDRDLRSVINYLSSQTLFGDLREKFVRLQQISTLLNLDPDEDFEEFFNGSGVSWVLTAQEARSIVNLKI